MKQELAGRYLLIWSVGIHFILATGRITRSSAAERFIRQPLHAGNAQRLKQSV